MLATISKHAVGFFLFLVVFVGSTTFIGLGNDESFASATWLASDARGRGRMSQDLVDSEVLVGLCEKQVVEMLGRPEKNWGSVHQYQINLGWIFKKPETYGLQVHYDQDRKVRRVKIVD